MGRPPFSFAQLKNEFIYLFMDTLLSNDDERVSILTNKVKTIRRLRKMRIEDLSAASGIPISTISDIERGAEPKVFTAIRIARALRTQVELLWII